MRLLHSTLMNSSILTTKLVSIREMHDTDQRPEDNGARLRGGIGYYGS